MPLVTIAIPTNTAVPGDVDIETGFIGNRRNDLWTAESLSQTRPLLNSNPVDSTAVYLKTVFGPSLTSPRTSKSYRPRLETNRHARCIDCGSSPGLVVALQKVRAMQPAD